MIGKGKRSQDVIDSMKKHGAVYFGAIGGAAALIAKSIVACEIVCYEDLGSEAIRKLTVKNFPATVVIDSLGNNLYESGLKEYLKSVA
jgi:fumarate hydratase subunit beta